MALSHPSAQSIPTAARIQYCGEVLDLTLTDTYQANGQIVIQAYAANGEPFATLSTCLVNETLAPDCTFIDTNNLPGICEVLVAEGIIELTGEVGASGFCTYPVARVLDSKK